MHKSILHFHFYRQGVHFSACFFLVGLRLARELGPPPGVASAVPAASYAFLPNLENGLFLPSERDRDFLSPVFYTAAPKRVCIRRLAGARHVQAGSD